MRIADGGQDTAKCKRLPSRPVVGENIVVGGDVRLWGATRSKVAS